MLDERTGNSFQVGSSAQEMWERLSKIVCEMEASAAGYRAKKANKNAIAATYKEQYDRFVAAATPDVIALAAKHAKKKDDSIENLAKRVLENVPASYSVTSLSEVAVRVAKIFGEFRGAEELLIAVVNSKPLLDKNDRKRICNAIIKAFEAKAG